MFLRLQKSFLTGEAKMNYELLKKNIIDTITEFQIKLGYEENSMGLYYPLESLNRLLETDLSTKEMQEELTKFSNWAKETLGSVECTHEKTRFRLTIPKEGVAFVYQNFGDNNFLREFIQGTRKSNCSIDDIVDIFKKYSDKIVCEKMDNDEFDYLIYFEDGIPDDYRYCLEFEFGYAEYHRFTPKDYEAFGF